MVAAIPLGFSISVLLDPERDAFDGHPLGVATLEAPRPQKRGSGGSLRGALHGRRAASRRLWV